MSETNKPGRTGLLRILWASQYSKEGLQAAWKHEAAFRQEALLMLFMLPLALWLGQTGIEKVLLAAPLFLVLIVELLNSAVESVVDRISSDIHPLSKQAKDMGSAAVLISLLLVAFSWASILLPRFLLWLG